MLAPEDPVQAQLWTLPKHGEPRIEPLGPGGIRAKIPSIVSSSLEAS